MFEFSLAETNLVPDVAMRKGLSMTDCYSKLWTFSNEYFPRDFIERERGEKSALVPENQICWILDTPYINYLLDDGKIVFQ